MKLIFETQFYENYGAHSWDGEGECPQYWKAKGGSTYIVEDYKFVSIEQFNADCDKMIKFFTVANDYMEEAVIDYSIEEDSFLSHDEKLQLEFDGYISSFAPRVTLDGVMTTVRTHYDDRTKTVTYTNQLSSDPHEMIEQKEEAAS